MKKVYIIRYNDKQGWKRIKIIKVPNADIALIEAEKFCSKNGRTLYAIDSVLV